MRTQVLGLKGTLEGEFNIPVLFKVCRLGWMETRLRLKHCQAPGQK